LGASFQSVHAALLPTRVPTLLARTDEIIDAAGVILDPFARNVALGPRQGASTCKASASRFQPRARSVLWLNNRYALIRVFNRLVT